MPDWLIETADPEHPRFRVELGDCTLEHAQSVVDLLERDTSQPTRLTLTEINPPAKRPWWRRIRG